MGSLCPGTILQASSIFRMSGLFDLFPMGSVCRRRRRIANADAAIRNKDTKILRKNLPERGVSDRNRSGEHL
jgi:hypothetical protein